MFRSLFRFSWDKRYKKTRTSRKKSMKDKCVVTQVKKVSTSMKIDVYKVAQISPSYAFSFLTNLVLFLVLKSTKLTILRNMTDKAGSNLLWLRDYIFRNWTMFLRIELTWFGSRGFWWLRAWPLVTFLFVWRCFFFGKFFFRLRWLL